MSWDPISADQERIGSLVVHAAYCVHRTLGPGLLESVYEACFCHELAKAGLSIRRQVGVPIVYDGVRIDDGLRLDVLVEDKVVCELKACEPHAVHLAQILSHLRLSGLRLGYLINFHTCRIKDGIKRVVA